MGLAKELLISGTYAVVCSACPAKFWFRKNEVDLTGVSLLSGANPVVSGTSAR